MKTLHLNQSEIETAVRENMSTPNSQTFIRSDDGSQLVCEAGQYHPARLLPDTVELIPMPALDPEGHGLELERFQEFSEIPPDGFNTSPCVVELKSYSDAINDEDLDIFDREDYFDYAVKEGWDTIQADWEASEYEVLSFLIAAWVEGLQTGSLDCINAPEPLIEQYQVSWI